MFVLDLNYFGDIFALDIIMFTSNKNCSRYVYDCQEQDNNIGKRFTEYV